jgi:hypothetical protein
VGAVTVDGMILWVPVNKQAAGKPGQRQQWGIESMVHSALHSAGVGRGVAAS